MRRRRVRTPKPSIKVKVKPARRPGKCTACNSRFYKGDEITYVTHRVRRFHSYCVPANIHVEATTPGAAPPRPAPPPLPSTPAEAAAAAMVALENALVVRAKKDGITPEMDKAFQRYQKLKALALNAGAFDNEAKSALRLSFTEIIKLVFA